MLKYKMDFINSSIFEKQLIQLTKKYKNVKDDFSDFESNFSLGQGKNLGKGIYKFRLKNSSIPTGKRGGFRVVLYVVLSKNKIIPIAIYSKSQRENILLSEIIIILNKILETL